MILGIFPIFQIIRKNNFPNFGAGSRASSCRYRPAWRGLTGGLAELPRRFPESCGIAGEGDCSD